MLRTLYTPAFRDVMTSRKAAPLTNQPAKAAPRFQGNTVSHVAETVDKIPEMKNSPYYDVHGINLTSYQIINEIAAKGEAGKRAIRKLKEFELVNQNLFRALETSQVDFDADKLLRITQDDDALNQLCRTVSDNYFRQTMAFMG